jgi:hypothetical protein
MSACVCGSSSSEFSSAVVVVVTCSLGAGAQLCQTCAVVPSFCDFQKRE